MIHSPEETASQEPWTEAALQLRRGQAKLLCCSRRLPQVQDHNPALTRQESRPMTANAPTWPLACGEWGHDESNAQQCGNCICTTDLAGLEVTLHARANLICKRSASQIALHWNLTLPCSHETTFHLMPLCAFHTESIQDGVPRPQVPDSSRRQFPHSFPNPGGYTWLARSLAGCTSKISQGSQQAAMHVHHTTGSIKKSTCCRKQSRSVFHVCMCLSAHGPGVPEARYLRHRSTDFLTCIHLRKLQVGCLIDNCKLPKRCSKLHSGLPHLPIHARTYIFAKGPMIQAQPLSWGTETGQVSKTHSIR